LFAIANTGTRAKFSISWLAILFTSLNKCATDEGILGERTIFCKSQNLPGHVVSAKWLKCVRGVFAYGLPFVVFLLPNASANETQNDQAAQMASYVGKTSTMEQKILPKKGETRALNLKNYYRSIGFDIESIRAHGLVPRLLLSSLPKDIHRIDRPRSRKALFIQAALPLILEVNEKILLDREKVMSLWEKISQGVELDGDEMQWLATIQENYGLSELRSLYNAAFFDAILERVDILPTSMVLAQSAEESGWGTSRFAREGNALFGQRIWSGTNGMKPRLRPRGERFLVRSFNNLLDGVWAYAFNLNTHSAYVEFRAARRNMRLTGSVVGGLKLISKLENYSERGEEYVRTIEKIIKVNQLEQFDGARLFPPLESLMPFSSGA